MFLDQNLHFCHSVLPQASSHIRAKSLQTDFGVFVCLNEKHLASQLLAAREGSVECTVNQACLSLNVN